MLVSWYIFVMISAFVDPKWGPHNPQMLKCDQKMWCSGRTEDLTKYMGDRIRFWC